MNRFARLTEKQDAKQENEAREEPKTMKSRLNSRISKIARLDNGTMVEAFKYLKYCQLAKNSLVSKRFSGVIRTHRHKLALLYVDEISMERRYDSDPAIKIFDNKLSPEEYNEWVERNNYSKRTALKISIDIDPLECELNAYGYYKDLNEDRTPVFSALIKELNQETLPLFEHFVRLLSDPFVFIRYMVLIPQVGVLNLLESRIERNVHKRLRCETLEFVYDDNAQTFFNWIKDHMLCIKFQIFIGCSSAHRDKQLLDFFATGSHCTSKADLIHSHLSNVVVFDLVQKFLDLKSCAESHIVQSIRGTVTKSTAEALKSNYDKFFTKEEKYRFGLTTTGWTITARIYEFVNTDIGKKMLLTVANAYSRELTLKIMNL